jgi:regulator of protease activity HflC (stomatin/prohibitin superfamily)
VPRYPRDADRTSRPKPVPPRWPRGRLENRGSAVQAFLLPGAIYVLVPATKQEASFEFTQETKDGIPLRFKGIVIYRITDPLTAARLFDFQSGDGVLEITALLTHVCLGELRDAVSHMTMVECIEQRKATLSGVVESALERAVHEAAEDAADWGITIEVAQVAQSKRRRRAVRGPDGRRPAAAQGGRRGLAQCARMCVG